jgi:hypothetical protein
VVLQAEQQGSVRLAIGGAARVGLAVGEAAEVEYSTTGRAVEVDCNAAVGQQGIGLAARGTSQQRSGGSAVPASDGR